MKDFFFKQAIQGLEKAGNNDFELIIEFGADAYSTEELKLILTEVRLQQKLASRWQQRLFILALSVVFWLAASILSSALGVSTLSYVFLAAIPISLICLLVGHMLIQSRYPGLKDSHLLASIVQQELEQRKLGGWEIFK